jgi:hypothetical protein
MEEIIVSLRHYWRFVDSEVLELKALSQGWPKKPHEHGTNSEIGEVRPFHPAIRGVTRGLC